MRILVLALLFISFTSNAYSADTLPDAVQDWLQANNTSSGPERDAIIDKAVSVDFVSSTMDGTALGGRDSLKGYLYGAHAAFGGYQIRIQDSALSGDRVWLRLKATGTHVGPLMGVEPSGRQVSVGLVVVLEITDQRITHEWQLSDVPALTRQLNSAATPVPSIGEGKR